MAERQMVRIKRTGPGVNEWDIQLSDGSDAPPIKSLTIDLAANTMPSLVLHVCDVDFDGALPPVWKVSPETLSAMAADAGFAVIEAGELAAFEQTLNQSRAETTRQAAENTRLRRKVEEFREAEALFKSKIERQNASLAAFREKTLDLLKENRAFHEARDKELAALTARFTEVVTQRQDALNTLMRERRSQELTTQTAAIREQYAPRAEPASAGDADALQDELTALKLERSADIFIVAGAREAARQRDAYEQENHILKRRLALGGIEAAQIPARETETYVPIIAVPTHHMAVTIQRTVGDAAKVVGYEQTLAGTRTNLVIVAAPTPEQAASARFWEQFEGSILPRLRARLTVGGQLVRL